MFFHVSDSQRCRPNAPINVMPAGGGGEGVAGHRVGI